jgi:hypothetical protein
MLSSWLLYLITCFLALSVTVVVPIMAIEKQYNKRKKNQALTALAYFIDSKQGEANAEQLKKLSTKALQNIITQKDEIRFAVHDREYTIELILREIAERELLDSK